MKTNRSDYDTWGSVEVEDVRAVEAHKVAESLWAEARVGDAVALATDANAKLLRVEAVVREALVDVRVLKTKVEEAKLEVDRTKDAEVAARAAQELVNA